MKNLFLGFSWLALLLTAHPGHAQVIRGTVVDSASNRPLEAAVIWLIQENERATAMAVTNQEGAFAVQLPRPARFALRVERAGYVFAQTDFFSLEGDASVTFRLPSELVSLDPLTVVAPNRNLVGFLDRQRLSWGRFRTPADLERSPAFDPAALLQGIQGIQVIPGIGFSRKVRVNARGRDPCIPTVYVDGFLAQRGSSPGGPLNSGSRRTQIDGVDLSEHVNISAVRGVEFYLDGTTAPLEFQPSALSNCGVLVVWTDWGLGHP